MPRVICPLPKRSKPSAEWFKEGKPQYYCYGWISAMTEELLEECQNCKAHVDKAQDDLEEYQKK